MSGEVAAAPRVLERAEHPVSRKNIDEIALKVLYRLHRAGYRGLLVGGSVRDLMLGRRPKDFDVATDARPGEVRRLFRNSRIIGRRFRLVHVFFREGIVEVSTFRAEPDPEEQGGGPEDPMITDDNVFGTARDDAFRRDFTVNALFYDIADFSVIDYVGGVDDLERHLIRTIGDPEVRLPEDPVRMMRACELAGRLGFGIEARTQEAIHRHRELLARASAARVTEEVVQLLRSGAAGAALQWMLDLALVEVLLPEAYALVAAGDRGLGDLGGLLPALDRRVAAGGEMTDGALLAVLLLPAVLLRRQDVEAVGGRTLTRRQLVDLIDESTTDFCDRFTVSGQRRDGIRQALETFFDFARPDLQPGERARIARRGSFDDALLLFELMVEATGEGGDELERWRDVRRRTARSSGSPPRAEKRNRGRRRGRGRRGRRGRRR